MKRFLVLGLIGAFTIPGCIVAVEGRSTHRIHHVPPPPPPPPADVQVEWHDARTVVLREYYDCDWETVGAFEYYEDDCGIPEDDLYFLLHVSRVTGRSFHDVVWAYNHNCGRVLWNVWLHYRLDPWGLYVHLDPGTSCPPAYHRAYSYYWRRDPRIVLTNYDCHALFYLRFGVNYYGWQPREHFVRWDRCVDDRQRFVTVIHRDYRHYAGRGGYNWNRRPVVKVVERPERQGTLVRNMRQQVRQSVAVEVRRRPNVVRAIPAPERKQRIEEHDRRLAEERTREREERRREPQRFEEYKKDPRDDRKDDRKDDRDDRKDDRRTPPPPPPKRPPQPPPKEDRKDDKKDDRRDDDRRDDRRDPPPPPPRDDRKDDRRNPPPPPPRDDRKNDRKDDKKDDRQVERKNPPPPPPPRRDPPPPPPKRNPPPPPPPKEQKKDEKKNDDKKQPDNRKEDRKDNRQRRPEIQPQQPRQAPAPRVQRAAPQPQRQAVQPRQAPAPKPSSAPRPQGKARNEKSRK